MNADVAGRKVVGSPNGPAFDSQSDLFRDFSSTYQEIVTFVPEYHDHHLNHINFCMDGDDLLP